MKKVIVAKNAGFCFGVKRAIDAATLAAETYEDIFSFGEIIHNADVVQMLEEKGVRTVEELSGIEGGNVLIRSHGVSPKVYADLKEKNVNIIDNTCPFVTKVHEMVKDSGQTPVIIIGKASHPEIIGVMGWAGENCHVVSSAEEAQALPPMEEGIVVAQTTLEKEQFDEITQVLVRKIRNPRIHNTICNATTQRQEEAVSIAKESNAMVVIGGKNSSNTKKLYDICKKYCKNVYLIENVAQFPLEIVKTNDIIGIVAGASTPDWIIREVLTTMSDENTNEQMEEQSCGSIAEENTATTADAADTQPTDQIVEDEAQASFYEDLEKSLVKITTNQIVTGSVVQVNDNEIFVNIGYKSDGVIPKSEYSNDQTVSLTDEVKVGDEIEVQVLKLNDGEGNVLLSKKRLAARKVWNDFEEKLEAGQDVVNVTVKEVVKGGLIAEAQGLRIFIPASLLDVRFIKDMTPFVGQSFDVKIIEFDKGKKKIVASRKELLAAEQAKIKEELWSKFEPKQEIEGTVKRLTDFGAFIDIGGIDGLLHVADIAWYRIEHPSEVLKVGDKIKVQILSINKEKERISLGLKQLQAKPWETVPEKYHEGDIVTGKVVRILDFGAFVELEPGIDGLIHISQVAPKRIEKVEDELTIGDTVECKVISVEADNKKISLSRKALMEPEEQEERAPRHSRREEPEDTYVPEIQDSSVSIAEFLPKDFLDELKNN